MYNKQHITPLQLWHIIQSHLYVLFEYSEATLNRTSKADPTFIRTFRPKTNPYNANFLTHITGCRCFQIRTALSNHQSMYIHWLLLQLTGGYKWRPPPSWWPAHASLSCCLKSLNRIKLCNRPSSLWILVGLIWPNSK